MATASLTRRVTFASAHRYHRPDWSDERNREVFGACANLNFHGHSYACDVTLSGPIDETTGMIVDLGALDGVLAREVRDRFDHRNINLEVPEFADGRLVPTGENLARFIFERVQAAVPGPARVTRVVVREDDFLSAEYAG
ncbi:MAG TPA: 6-carboxytetrahydropterin synthase [Gemmatimonadaceae bacterium]